MNDLAFPQAAPSREQIVALENQLAAMPQVELEVRHHFAPGVYVRELVIPAGVAATGRVHLTEHITILSAGRAILVSEGNRQEIVAPCTFVTAPGSKKAIVALETCHISNVHPTTETDVDLIEKQFTVGTFAEYEQYLLEAQQQPQLGEG